MIRSTILVLALLSAAQAWSWGDTGHRIICEIAFQELTDTARAEVIRLIRMDDEFTRFYDSCTWPDHPRQRSIEHYANFPRATRKVTTKRCLTADECIFKAIAADLAVLNDSSATDAARLASLKFLGHWVGDIHQPLHVSFQDDRGGNDVVEGDDPQERNLHAIWDIFVIRDALLEPPHAGRRIRDFAQNLQASVTDRQRHEWHSHGVATWANESLQIAIAPETGYCDLHDGSCIYDLDTNRETYTAGEERRKVVIDADYLETHAPTVEARLLRAGVRLGGLLNKAFAGQ